MCGGGCSFHGIFPSKNKQEKRLKKATEEIMQRKLNTTETTAPTLQKMREIQQASAAPFVVSPLAFPAWVFLVLPMRFAYLQPLLDVLPRSHAMKCG